MKLDPVQLIEKLEAIGAKFGVGRGIHLGDTIIGTKGRVAFEAPAAEVLISAHRELEKLVMTGRQQRIKEMLAGPYGDLVHEGQHLDPVCRDIEALFVSSQARVTRRSEGDVSTRQCLRRRRDFAVLDHGGVEGRVRRSCGRMDRRRCARLLEDGRLAGHVLDDAQAAAMNAVVAIARSQP